MFNKIIVPLDGSKLAESVVPHAATMARLMGAEVILVRVDVAPRGHSAARFRTIHTDLRVEVPNSERDLLKARHPIYKDQEMASRKAELLDSLAEVETYFRNAGVSVSSQVLFGRPTEQILYLVEEEQAGAIMMSTHGDRGIGPWPLGDTTKRIIRLAQVPVIVTHPVMPKAPEIDMRIGR
jgi:nucleotide-binding universal stress UspA family protein